MFDIKKVEADAAAEVAKEEADKARGKIKASLQKINSAEAVLANCRREHEVLLKTIGE